MLTAEVQKKNPKATRCRKNTE